MTSLPTPKLKIVLEAPSTGELTEYIVQTDNRDMVAFDLTRNRKNWPSMDDANMLWMNFIGHHAISKRGGVAISFDDFLAQCVECFPVDQDGEEVSPEAAASGVVSAESFPQALEVSSARPSHSA